jgi:hypothetical protein
MGEMMTPIFATTYMVLQRGRARQTAHRREERSSLHLRQAIVRQMTGGEREYDDDW